MCRHLGYLGPAVALDELIMRPNHSLLEQTWAPRDMRGGGTVNADGFGVGWYPDTSSAPLRYRSASPLWTDRNFGQLATEVRSGAVIAAVRSATVGMPIVETACAPFTDGHWLFSHNGRVSGWPESLAKLASESDPVDLMTLEAPVDSAVVWTLTRQRIAATRDPTEAVPQVMREILAAAPESRMNLLLTNGTVLIATTWTHALWARRSTESVILASEPFGTEHEWEEIPDRHLVVAREGKLSMTALF